MLAFQNIYGIYNCDKNISITYILPYVRFYSRKSIWVKITDIYNYRVINVQ